MKIGTKNTVVVTNATNKIDKLTNLFRRKRISYEEYFSEVNICLVEMTTERDFLEYMKNIGYFDKFVK